MPSMHSPVPTTLLGGLHMVAVAQPSTTCGSAPYMPADWNTAGLQHSLFQNMRKGTSSACYIFGNRGSSCKLQQLWQTSAEYQHWTSGVMLGGLTRQVRIACVAAEVVQHAPDEGDAVERGGAQPDGEHLRVQVQ